MREINSTRPELLFLRLVVHSVHVLAIMQRFEMACNFEKSPKSSSESPERAIQYAGAPDSRRYSMAVGRRRGDVGRLRKAAGHLFGTQGVTRVHKIIAHNITNVPEPIGSVQNVFAPLHFFCTPAVTPVAEPATE